MRVAPLFVLCLSVGCSEYDLAAEPAPVTELPSGTLPSQEPETTSEVPEQTGSRPIELPCDDSYSDSLPWVRSGIWTEAAAPVDGAGRAWFEPDFDDGSWEVLGGLPDEDWATEDHDVFYRARFWLDEVRGRTEIEFVGNDGVWLYANGAYLGHWGGEWRAGGCINEPVNCGENSFAPPVEVTDFLVPGDNVLAVMLTNGPTGFYLEINATCVEE